jgi:MFS family permease
MAQAAFADALILEPLNAGTPARILGLFALTLVPYSLVSPFLGVFVDRWTRRGLMLWANVARGVVLASLPLWSRAVPGVGPLYVSVLVLLGLGRLFLTTKGAVIPMLLEEPHLLKGNAVSSGGGMIAALVGGASGLGVLAVLSARATFVVVGAMYMLAGVVVGAISRPLGHRQSALEPALDAIKRVGRELGDGARQVWARRRVRLSLIGIFLLRTISMFIAIAAILVIKQHYNAPGDRLGRLSAGALALGTAGAGALIAALTAPAANRRLTKPRLVLLGFGVSAAGLLVLGGLASLPAILGLTFAGGYGAFVAKVSVDTQVQEDLPDAYLGRAFSLYDILYNLASVVAAGVLLAFAEASPRAVLLPAGLLTLGLAALLGAAMRNEGMFR